jgi:hypothetical protein
MSGKLLNINVTQMSHTSHACIQYSKSTQMLHTEHGRYKATKYKGRHKHSKQGLLENATIGTT